MPGGATGSVYVPRRPRRLHAHEHPELRADRRGRGSSMDRQPVLRSLRSRLPADRAPSSSPSALLTARCRLHLPAPRRAARRRCSRSSLFVFQYLLARRRRGATSAARSSRQRTRELASLQVGLLNTVLQTLSMRDAMTARHSAAVARYAREVARLLGLSRARAGPDPHRRPVPRHRQVHLPRLDPLRRPQADRRRVGDRQAPPRAGREARPAHRGLRPGRRHRAQPPRALRRPRLSLRACPASEIPLGSRIIAAADTYDVMTSRDSYRARSSSEDALAELRRVAGTQLDPMVVETFVELIERARRRVPPHRRGRLRGGARVRERVSRLRAPHGRLPHDRWTDVRSVVRRADAVEPRTSATARRSFEAESGVRT